MWSHRSSSDVRQRMKTVRLHSVYWKLGLRSRCEGTSSPQGPIYVWKVCSIELFCFSSWVWNHWQKCKRTMVDTRSRWRNWQRKQQTPWMVLHSRCFLFQFREIIWNCVSAMQYNSKLFRYISQFFNWLLFQCIQKLQINGLYCHNPRPKTLCRADIGKEWVGSGLSAVVPPLLCKFEL